MTNTVEPFPQRSVKPAKTTPADIVRDAESPEQALALLSLAFPNMAVAQLIALLEQAQREGKEQLAAFEAETRAMEAIGDLVGPVMQAHPNMRVSEALEVLAGEGSEQAAALLAQLDGPEARLHDLLLAKAVECDPYWSKTEDGGYRVRAGATHKTPEALVAAYIESRGDHIADDVPADLLEYFGRQEFERQAAEELGRRGGHERR